jgi:hypothetical protein
MRIAAGVLFILVSGFDGCAGMAYGLGGGLTAAAGSVAGDMAAAGALGSPGVAAEAASQASDVQATGSMLAIFGLFLLVLAGLDIAAGVCLFISKAAGFVKVVSILELVATFGSLALIGGVGVGTLLGVAAGVLGLMSAKKLAEAGGPGEAAPAAAAPASAPDSGGAPEA